MAEELVVKLTGDAKELEKELKSTKKSITDWLKEVAKAGIKLGIDKEALKESAKDANDKLKDYPLFKTTKRISVAINQKNLDTSVNEAQRKLDRLKDVNLKVNLDIKDATSGIMALYKMLTEISKPVKIDINADVRSITTKLQNIQGRLDTLKMKLDISHATSGIMAVHKMLVELSKPVNISIDTNNRSIIAKLQNIQGRLGDIEKQKSVDVDTSKFNYKLTQLATYINQFNSKDIEPKVDKAISNVVKLSTYMNQLKSKDMKLTIDADIQKAKTGITAIYMMIKELSDKKYKLGLDVGELTKKNPQLQTTANTLKNIADALKRIKTKTVNFNFNTGSKNGNLATAVRTIRNLNKALNDIKNNIIVNIKVNDNDSLPKLREIAKLLLQIKRNSRININTRNSGGFGGGSGGSGGGSGGGSVGGGYNPFETWWQKIAYSIRYSGRASKGIGSWLEAQAQLTTDLGRVTGGTGAYFKLVAGVTAVIGVLATFGKALDFSIRGAQLFGNMLINIGESIYNVLRPGIELYKQQQSALFSMSASLMANGAVNGQRLSQMPEGSTIARGLSNEIIQRATLDAEMSAFSLEEILRSLQGTLPILMNLGMSLDEAYQVNKGVAGVAKMIQLTPSQILQETRDIAQGSITSRGSQVANALGITNADLQQYQGNAEALFNFLKERFKNYGELLNEFEDTALGRYQQLEERWQAVTKNIVDGVAPMFKGLFEGLITLTGQWVDKNGKYLDAITGEWHNASGEVIATQKDIQDNGYEAFGIEEPHFQLSEELEKAKEVLQDLILYWGQALDTLWEYIEAELGISDPLEFAKTIIKLITDAFVFCAELVVDLISLIKSWEAPLSVVLHICRDIYIGIATWVDIISVSIVLMSKFYDICRAVYKFLMGDIKGAQEILADVNNTVEKSAKSAINNAVDRTSKNWMGVTFESFFGERDQTKKDGWLFNKLQQYIGKDVSGNKGDSKGVGSKDVSGIPNDKANKEAIKESQRMLKEKLRELKDALNDALDDLKEVLNKNKIAYEEGFMSIKDYFTQKADIERQEAELKLQEAYDRQEAIQSSQFENDYEKVKAEQEVSRDIKKYSKEVEKMTRQQKEVARNIAYFTNSQKQLFSAYSSMIKNGSVLQNVGKGKKTDNYVTTEFNAQSFEDKVALAMQIAMERGFDREAAAGMVGNWITESGGELDPNALGDGGTSFGIAQWHNERWDALKEYAEQNHADWHDFVTQINFALSEVLEGNEKGNYFANNGGVEQQVQNYMDNVERPAEWAKAESISGRISNGLLAYDLATRNVGNFGEKVQQVSGSLDALVSGSGDLLGIVADTEHNLQGLDTRFMEFQDMSGGVEAQAEGLQDEVKKSINLIAKEFFERTGQKIEWSSFTGSSLHSTGEWGHYAGWKADANIDERLYEVLKEILTKYGVAAGVEDVGTGNQHVDMSWAYGGVGGPDRGGYYLTDYITGESFYEKSRNATQQAISAIQSIPIDQTIEDVTKVPLDLADMWKKIGEIMATVGIYDLPMANTTDVASEIYKAGKKLNQETIGIMAENTSRIMGNYQGQLLKLTTDFYNDISQHRSGSAEDNTYLEARYDKYRFAVADAIKENFEGMLEFNLAEIERNSKFRGTDLYEGKYSFKELTEMYRGYFTDVNNKNGIAFAIKQLEDAFVSYSSNGFLKEAQEIRDKLEQAKDSLYEMFDSWIEQGQKYWENAEAIFDATPRFTPTQREFAEREFKAYRSQREYNDRTQKGIALEADYKKNLKDINALIKANKGLVKDSKQYNDNLNSINSLVKDNSRIKAYIQENEQLKKMADLTSKMPDYLDDIGKAARDALDNGLVEFLTDGITEAESLSDALRDLATGILKEIQKVSAKWMVKGLMNGLFGQFDVDKEMPLDYTGQLDIINNSIIDGANRIVGAIGGQVGQSNYQGTSLLAGVQTGQPRSFELNSWQKSPFYSGQAYAGLGAFSSSWGQSPLNPNAQTQTQTQTVSQNFSELSGSLADVNTQFQTTSTMSLPSFTDSISDVTNDIQADTSISNSTQQLASQIDMGSSQFQSAFSQVTNILETVATTLQTIASSLQSVSTQISSLSFGTPTGASTGALVKNNRILKFAKGGAVFRNSGLINGPGSETSDSIPAMLSNGEAVLNAKAVKELGVNFISAVNNGEFSRIRAKIPHFSSGGTVNNTQQMTARGMSDFARNISTNVSTNNQMNIALVKDEREAMEHFLRSPQGQRIMVDFQKGNGRVFSRFSDRF